MQNLRETFEMVSSLRRSALAGALGLLWLAAGCGGGDSGLLGGSSGSGGRGPVGTLVFWGGQDAEPMLLDTRNGVLNRGQRWPRYAFQLSADGWAGAFTENGHLNVFRLLGDGLWEFGGDIGAWVHGAYFSPDNRSIVGITSTDFQTKQAALHYGSFNEDGSQVEQGQIDGAVNGVVTGASQVSWSPDSEHYVVVLADGLALYRRGERVWFLPNVHVSGLARTRVATFSPDGQWLAIAIYETPKLNPVPIHRGYQLYSVPDRTFVRYLGAVQDDKGGNLDVNDYYTGATGVLPDAPLWTPDSSGLVLQRKRLMLENSSNSCGNENPVPLQVLRIPESFLQATPVIDDLSVLVPDERLGDRCLRWHHIGSIPEHDALLYGFEYREKRYFGRASPGVANSAYVVVELYFVEVPLDGSEAREIGWYDNNSPEPVPFGVWIYPFLDYSLRCRSGQTGDLVFRNGLVLNMETEVATRINEIVATGVLSGDCNCYTRTDDFTQMDWGIYDLRGNLVATYDLEPALQVTTNFVPYDWR